jgi:hypothetical protein
VGDVGCGVMLLIRLVSLRGNSVGLIIGKDGKRERNENL